MLIDTTDEELLGDNDVNLTFALQDYSTVASVTTGSFNVKIFKLAYPTV